MKIEDVKKLTLAPGEVLVLTLGEKAPQEAIASMISSLTLLFPDNRVVVLEPGMVFSKIKAEDAT